MSGPKHGEYINYRAEIEQERGIIQGYIKDIKGLFKSIEDSLILDSKENEIIQRHAGQEWQKESKRISDYISNAKVKLSKIESSLNITNYDFSNLSKIRQLNQEAKNLLEDVKKEYDNFRKTKIKILSISQERANEYKIKTERELKEKIEPDLKFLEEWAFDDRIDELKRKLDNFKNLDFSKVEEERNKILNLYDELKSKALKNKKNFEIKKDTSDKLISILIEMNYDNIERTLEGGVLGNIVIKAETPDKSWNVLYEIGNDGQIKAITPNDDRCYINLEDINKRLKDYGIQVDIKELQRKEKKKEQAKERERERER